ncbi:MAG: hypothetical protein AB1757_27670 [Acidobacteriota bacterium]
MLRSEFAWNKKNMGNVIERAGIFFILTSCLLLLTSVGYASEPPAKFERTYNTTGRAHLTISNINGSINVTAWNRKAISVFAKNDASAPISEQVTGDNISLSVRKSLTPGRADFQIYAPAETSIQLNNYIGQIEVRGVRGDVKIKSFDSEIRLIEVRLPSADVSVTTGDIFFDGELAGDGPYTFQTLRGDVDVSLPSGTSFQLSTRALSENINLGDFMNSLTGTNRAPKGITGTHLKGGPRLNLITFNGRILLHKK